MEPTLRDHEDVEGLGAQTDGVLAESNGSDPFLQEMLFRTSSVGMALTPRPISHLTDADTNPPYSTFTQALGSSRPTTRSGRSTPLHNHACNLSTSTVPTSPMPQASPNIKADVDTTLATVKEAAGLSNTASLPPAMLADAPPAAAAAAAAEPERRSTSRSHSSVDATRGSDSSSDARRRGVRNQPGPLPELLWGVGTGVCESDSTAEQQRQRPLHREHRRRRRQENIVIEQEHPGDVSEPEHIVLLRKSVYLQEIQTAFVGVATVVVVAVALYRL